MSDFDKNMSDAMLAIYRHHAQRIRRTKSVGGLDEAEIDRQATKAMHRTLQDQRLVNEIVSAAMSGPVALNLESETHHEQ